jgi:hypothetical protein
VSAGEVLGRVFSGLDQGFNTYAALKQAMEEQQHQRRREGIEDQDRRDRLNLDYQRETREQRAQEYTQRRDRQNTALQALKDAGVYGATPDMLDADRNGNQVQTGTGAGVGDKNLVGNAMRSLTLAVKAPGYDPRKGADLGNGLRLQGPDFGKVETQKLQKYVNRDGNYHVLDLESGEDTNTGQPARESPWAGMAGRQFIQDPQGNVFLGDKNTGTVAPVQAPGGQPFQGSGARPTEGERSGDMLLLSAVPAIERATKYYGSHGAPGIVSQTFANAARGNGLISGLANSALGALDPEYQEIQPDITKIYRAWVYATTGKALNESEAQDAAIQYVPKAGEDPATTKAKINGIQEMAKAVGAASRRAANFRQNIPGNAPAVPTSESPADRLARLKAKHGLR